MKILKRLGKALLFTTSFLILLVLKLVQPIVRFELCIVGFHRYGHLALEPEVHLAEQEIIRNTSDARKRVVSFWSFGPVSKQSNTFLANKWKEELLDLPSWLIGSLHTVGLILPFLKLNEPKLSIRGNMNCLDKTMPHISFSSEESEEGRKRLIEIGVNPDKPYVCLVVRDGGHYASKGDIESTGHDIVNFDIDTFSPSVEFLAKEGFQVVRMGSGTEKPFSILPTGVIDYAHSPHRSEFLDVYIAGTCSFAISTQTGPDAVCMVFRRPVLYVDVTRFSQFFFGMNAATWAPARLQKDGRILRLSEIVNSDVVWYKDPNDFLLNGIEQQKSTPEELLLLVKSYVGCLRGTEKLTEKYSLRVSEGLGERGKKHFGEISAKSVPNLAEILGEWVNN